MATREKIKSQIIEYMKMYVPDGEPIGAEKIMRLFEKGVCPLCNGTGEIEFELRQKSSDNKVIAKKLRSQGFTIRSIANKLGYKHPGSISHLLKQGVI